MMVPQCNAALLWWDKYNPRHILSRRCPWNAKFAYGRFAFCPEHDKSQGTRPLCLQIK